MSRLPVALCLAALAAPALASRGLQPGRAVALPDDPGPDDDADGLLDAADHCPRHAEDPDGWFDDDGCPDPTIVLLRIVDLDGAPLVGTLTVDGVALPQASHGLFPVGPKGLDVQAEVPGHAPLRTRVGPLEGAPRVVLLPLIQDSPTGV